MQSRHRSHIGRGHRYAVGESKEVSGDREAGAETTSDWLLTVKICRWAWMPDYRYTAIRWLIHWPLVDGLLQPEWDMPRPLAVPNVTAHPSTVSVPITVLMYNGCDSRWWGSVLVAYVFSNVCSLFQTTYCLQETVVGLVIVTKLAE